MVKNKFNSERIKKDFPIFTHYPNLVYLDNAATSQKPYQVINAVRDFYEKNNANIHRGIYTLSQHATELFENTRNKIARFINADDVKEVIFTANASEAINLVAYGWARKFLQKGDIIITSDMEHHSNILPWLRLKDELGIDVHFLPISFDYKLDYTKLDSARLDVSRIKLIALTHASNVLGTINPIKEIIEFMNKRYVHAKILVDAAQSIPHIDVDVTNLGCDFLVFSSHKMLGPSGVGVLWTKKEILEVMDPLFTGSHMIKTVSKEKVIWAELPDRFETGTRNLEGVIGLGAAIEYIEKIGIDAIIEYEHSLTEYTLNMLENIPDITIFGPKNAEARLGVFSFKIDDIHAHDMAEILNRNNIAVRSGHHCAQTVMQHINESATVRASIYLYNTKMDIQQLAEGITVAQKIFNK